MGSGFVLFIPVVIIYILYAYIALFGDYFANQPFSELVTVKNISCNHSRRTPTALSIDIINTENKKQNIDFPTNCDNLHNIYRLEGKNIELTGRQWTLGKIYDSLSYDKDIDLS